MCRVGTSSMSIASVLFLSLVASIDLLTPTMSRQSKLKLAITEVLDERSVESIAAKLFPNLIF